MKTKLYLIALFAQCFSITTFAYDAEIGGIYYNLNSDTKQAEVTYRTRELSSYDSYYGSVNIPETITSGSVTYSVTSIGDWAFEGCLSLTSVSIPNSMRSIGEMAFYRCSGLSSVHIKDIASWCNIDFSDEGSNPLYHAHHLYVNGKEITDLDIPDGVTSISNLTFYGWTEVTSVTIPNSVLFIGVGAFRSCTKLKKVVLNSSAIVSRSYSIESSLYNIFCNYVTEYIIGNDVTSIGNYAFSDCDNMTSVTIPNSVKTIGKEAFRNCSGLQTVNITDLAAWCNIYFVSEYYSNPLLFSNHLLLNGKEITDLVIPDGVTSIESHAFQECSHITSVTIPNSVTWIGYGAFLGCSSLTKVNITDLASWCKIGFYDNNSNPLNFAHSLYMNGQEIKNLIIPDGVTSIGSYAFRTLYNLTFITIPNSVTSIGDHAFESCTGVTSVTLSDNIARIGASAFEYCNKITSVTIPNSIEYIGAKAFANCKNLLDVYCYSIFGPETDSEAFLNSQFGRILHVPERSLKSYMENEPWSGFAKIVAIEDESYTPTSISLNYTSVSLTVDDSWQLTASVSPSGAPQSVTWSVVSGSSYVSVSPSGLVTANGAGIATVRATSTANALVYKDCVITVQNPVIEGVAINNTNFPDSNFRNWILSQDYGQDGIITDGEFANITEIEVDEKNIQSLKGIEFFVNLTSLDCERNQLTSLDLTSNNSLKYLYCQRNKLTSLDVSKCTALKELHCKGNLLTSLDVSKCRAMKDLSCYDNRLSTLDISGCTALEELSCHDNNLTTLDVSGYTALSHFSCYNNNLTSLNVSNTALRELNCYQNKIKGDAMDAFIASLPTITNGQLYAIYFENEGNMMTTTQVAAAKEKGWKTYNCIGQYYSEGGMQDDGYYDKWQEYTGFDPASAINSLAADTDADDSASWYTLGGAQLTGKPTQPGIYIHGGKKVIVK